MDSEEQRNRERHRQAGQSALSPEPPGRGQDPGVGSYSRTLRITTPVFLTVLAVTGRRLKCHVQMRTIWGRGPWPEESQCLVPHAGDVQGNMRMSVAAF